eukprot:95733-Prymnesium_polylepis.2
MPRLALSPGTSGTWLNARARQEQAWLAQQTRPAQLSRRAARAHAGTLGAHEDARAGIDGWQREDAVASGWDAQIHPDGWED